MKNLLLFVVFCLVPSSLFSQLNVVELDKKLVDGSSRYSGSAGYANDQGLEFALVGARSSLAAFAIEADTLRFIDAVPGPTSNWREIAVIGDFAYVSTEGSGSGQGLQVVDLSNLPASISLLTTYDASFTRGHIVQSDLFNPESNYIYVAGVTPGGGVHILDVTDPQDPQLASIYQPYYIHDVHVRGNTMYAAAIYNGTLDIVDISDKSNPQLITQLSYPNPFTHSAFTSEDWNYIFVTDEIDGTPMRVWDISDLQNPEEVAQYSGNTESLVHNPYVVGDFCYISHNTEGLRVLDIRDPELLVEVGYFDTWDGTSGGFSGLWSAWPFLPSGRILGGDRTEGLYLWSFDTTYAGRIYGTVKDSITQQAIVNAFITLDAAWTSGSDILGNFNAGAVPGDYVLSIQRSGYQTKTIPITLNEMDSIWLDVELLPLTTSVNEPDKGSIEVWPNPASDKIFIRLESGNLHHVSVFDVSGRELLSAFPEGQKELMVDLGSFQPGVYSVLAELQNGDSFIRRIVLSR